MSSRQIRDITFIVLLAVCVFSGSHQAAAQTADQSSFDSICRKWMLSTQNQFSATNRRYNREEAENVCICLGKDKNTANILMRLVRSPDNATQMDLYFLQQAAGTCMLEGGVQGMRRSMEQLENRNADPIQDAAAAYKRNDYVTAAKLYRLSADQGNAKAQFALGFMYASGRSVTQDDKEAVKWYRLSADQGNAKAQFALGFMYASGRGVTQDYVRAHMWVNISASSGNTLAESNRDKVATLMTPTQIQKAQEMARLCMKTNYKNCD